MDEKVNHISEYRCKLCNKIYSSPSSLCNHNKKFHNNETKKCQVLSSNVKQMSSKCQVLSSKIFCDVCNKEFNTRQAKSLHKKKCTFELYNENEIKMKEMELQLKSQEKEILKLKLKLQKSKKADIATVNQLNKLLLERHNKYQNYINNINNGNIYNNNIVNNFQLVGF